MALNIEDYKKAIKYLDTRSNTLQLYSFVGVKDNSSEPFCHSGNFSVVFKIQHPENKCFYAIKCFTHYIHDRKLRYQAISDFLKDKNIPYFINYEYLENEIFIESDEYSVLKMDWIEGRTFGEVISDACTNYDIDMLQRLIIQWDNLCHALKKHQIAHGDLKHDNIIVTPDIELKLVDYDGMFVPALRGFQATETGTASYQHPSRDESWFDETLDEFSILIISLSLLALKHSPHLHKKYNMDNTLIFKGTDFTDLKQSQLINDLKQINDMQIQTYIKLLEDIIINENYKRIISVKNPTYFILLIDRSNHMKIEVEKNTGPPLQNINDIIKNLITDMQNLCTKNSHINDYFYLSIIYYNSSPQQNTDKQPLGISLSAEKIIQQSNSCKNFEQAIISIRKTLEIWTKKYKGSYPPTIFNISTNYISIDPADLNQDCCNNQFPLLYNICNFYQEDYNNQTIRFPKLMDKNFASDYKTIYENSSTIPDSTCRFLKDNYKIDCQGKCKGMLLNAKYPLIYKFLHSAFKGPFHQVK